MERGGQNRGDGERWRGIVRDGESDEREGDKSDREMHIVNE